MMLLSQQKAGLPQTEKRDSSKSSSMSSSSSSNSRSINSSNFKSALATAIRDFNLLATEHDRRRYLIEKSYIFARDKNGCQMLQNKINEEVQIQAQMRSNLPS